MTMKYSEWTASKLNLSVSCSLGLPIFTRTAVQTSKSSNLFITADSSKDYTVDSNATE